jgi:hypothetical protein
MKLSIRQIDWIISIVIFSVVFLILEFGVVHTW